MTDDRYWAKYVFDSRSLDPREPWELTTRKPKPKRTRKPSLIRALKQANRAGVAVSGATIDGVSLEFGKRTNTAITENTIDNWISKHAH